MTDAVVTIPTELPEVVFREMRDGDLAFVVSSWLRSFASSKLGTMTDAPAYYEGYRRLVEAALGRSRVLVACQREDQDAIVGWICVEPRDVPVVHYVYVKHPYRRFGIAQMLVGALASKPCAYTHRSEAVVRGRVKVPERWAFNPWLFLAGGVK